jgi:hypothetical protein
VDELLAPGVQTLSVDFTPEDTANYAPAHATVSLTVTLVTPKILWPAPAPIAYGTPLSAAQLNATTTVPGDFAYTPSLGEMLPAGEHTISVSFTPKDPTVYRTAGAAVSLVVNKATPIVSWPAPTAITYDTALSAEQLNATVLVPGTLIYAPSLDEVLPVGTHTLRVTFVPADALNYTTVEAAVPLKVTRQVPAASWTASDPINFGKTANTSQFESEPELAKPASAPVERPAFWPRPESANSAPEAPAKPPAAKPVAKIPANKQVKVAQEPAAKQAARPHVRLSEKHPTKGQTHDEAPANALIKTGAPKLPIEVGPGLDLMGSAVLEDGTTIYLVMQPGTAGIANSSRLVSQLFSAKGPKPGFVINRFEPQAPESNDESAPQASGHTRSGFGFKGHSAQPAEDEAEKKEKKSGFSLKGFGRSIWSKLAASEKTPAMTRLGLGADPMDGGGAQPETNESPVYASAAGAPTESSHRGHHPTVHGAGASHRHEEAKTRVYRGATYVKGEDGQWHLQETPARVVPNEAEAIPFVGAAQMNAESRAGDEEPAAAPAKESVRKAKPAKKKVPAKAAAKKKPAQPAARPAKNAMAKQPVKSAAKPAAKTSANRPVKPVSKPAVKTSAKPASRASAKPAVKATAQQPVKAAVKSQAKVPVRKPVSAKKTSVIAARPKPAKKAAASTPPVNLQAPEPGVIVPPQEFIAAVTVPEVVKES